MDSNGNTVNNEKGSFGCKVTYNVFHPDMILCMDKVGLDTSQKGDVAVGGNCVCPVGTTPKEK